MSSDYKKQETFIRRTEAGSVVVLAAASLLRAAKEMKLEEEE